jgi:cation-transporting ATPase E
VRVAVSILALAVYLAYLTMTRDVEIARTALTTATVLCGLVLISFVAPPTQAWAGGDVLSDDWRPTLLAAGMLALYAAIAAVPPLRTFFEPTLLQVSDWLAMGVAVVVWALLLRPIWRAQILKRLLALEAR